MSGEDSEGSCSSESSSSWPRGFEDLKRRGRLSLSCSLHSLLGFKKKSRRAKAKEERLKKRRQKKRKARRDWKAVKKELGEDGDIFSSESEEDLEQRVLQRMKIKRNCDICYLSQELLESRCKHRACKECWDAWFKVKT